MARKRMSAICFLSLMSLAVTAMSVTPTSLETSIHQRVRCGSRCFLRRTAKAEAKAECKGKRMFCKVIPCKVRAKNGFKCAKKPTSPTSSPVPEFVDPDGMVSFPAARLGEQISFRVNVTVSSGSGATREDLYLLSDATGSMETAISTSKTEFKNLVEARAAVSSDVAFGVGFYRDEQDVPFRNLQSLTKDASKALSAIRKLQAQGGRDGPEANLYALSEVATRDSIGWRADSRKILVYFGDYPGHEPTCPGGVPLKRKNVITQLNAKNITVVATSFSPGLDRSTTSATGGIPGLSFDCGDQRRRRGGQATAITSATGGDLVPASSQKDLIDEIIGSVSTLTQILTVDTSSCDGKIDVTFPITPPFKIQPGKTFTFTEKATIVRGACSSRGAISCDVKFILSGVEIGTQTIKARRISGC